tara:strand:- start:125 stop:523 length:399 start_codon:yes stop_codon:yes gene_type:complete
MEGTVKDTDKDKNSLIFVDYTKVSKALLKYEKAFEHYHKNVLRPALMKEWEGKQNLSKIASVRCFDCGKYIEVDKIDDHHLECTKVKPKAEAEIMYVFVCKMQESMPQEKPHTQTRKQTGSRTIIQISIIHF